MEVRLLHIEACPNTEATLRLLKECLAHEQVATPIIVIEVKDEVQAKELRFLGSPSIQIDGEDIEMARRKDAPFLGCRIYKVGSPDQGVPSPQLIIQAIHSARARA